MSGLPETTAKDLQTMGITAGMIKEAIERTGADIRGTIVRVVLPRDNFKKNRLIRRAHNYLKSDWEFVAERPPVIIKEERYDESFDNFDNNSDTPFLYNKSITTTSGNNYTLTQSFNVSVNANVPLGLKGAMIGFNASQSETEVKSHSISRTESRAVSFTVPVPAGEGRIVSSVTIQTSTDQVVRALMGVQGTVGIEVDPAWYLPNHYWWLYNIEDVFPNASAKREIIRSRIDTKIDTIIRKIDCHKVGDIMQCKILMFPDTAVDQNLLTNTLASSLTNNVGCDTAEILESEAPDLPAFTTHLRVTIHFDGTNPIDIGRRQSLVQRFLLVVQAQIQPLGCIGIIRGITWLPNMEVLDQATFDIPFDPTRIDRNNLSLQVVRCSCGINWNGFLEFAFD